MLGVLGGAGGIRTLDTVLPYTHFPGERLRPLGHRSAFAGRAPPSRKARAIGQPCSCRQAAPMPAAMRALRTTAYADEIEAIARAALLALPRPFADSIGDIVLQVEEFADDGRSTAGHRGPVRPDRAL